ARVERRLLRPGSVLLHHAQDVPHVERPRAGSFDLVIWSATQEAVGQQRVALFLADVRGAMMSEGPPLFAAVTALFLPYDLSFDSQALNLDFKFRYLRHFPQSYQRVGPPGGVRSHIDAGLEPAALPVSHRRVETLDRSLPIPDSHRAKASSVQRRCTM